MSVWGDRVLSTLKPIWTLSQVFGLCPRLIDEGITRKTPSFIRKLLLYFYVIVAVLAAFFFAYATSEFKIIPNVNIVTQLADILFNFTNNVSMLSSVIFCLLHQNKLTRVVCRLQEIEKKLKNLFKWESYKQVKIFIVCELLFTFGIWTSFFVYYVIVRCPASAGKCFRNWLIIYTSTKISQVVLVAFCAYVMVLRHKLRLINENLKQFFKQHSGKSGVSDIFYEKTLNEIEKVYNEIMVACSEVQTIFSIPLLMKIANQFVSIFSALYFCVFGYLYNDQFIKPRNFNDAMIPFTTILIAIVEILTTVTVCELTVLEFRSTGKLIYRIPMSRNNVMLMKRINLFSLQLIHKNFEFSAGGFFKINGSLLQTIVGAVTVYLVMFIQFDIATNKATP